MQNKPATFDILGIGNALVDILVQVDDAFLIQHGLSKGHMQLVDAAQISTLYHQVGQATEMSGGSGANTAVGVVSCGGRAAYIGKIADDQLGTIFRHDSEAVGVHFRSTPQDAAHASTGCCLILITPDGERTMNTYLGASTALTTADIDEELVRESQITYLEGYLFDPPAAKSAFYHAAELAQSAGRSVAMTLSDVFCVERHRRDFLDLLGKSVDIVFSNIAEATALFETASAQQIVSAFRDHCSLAIVTRGSEPTWVITPEEWLEVPVNPVAKVIDTTGAGDLYAAGFLYGYTHGMGLQRCAQFGGVAAGNIIQQRGARPLTPLHTLLKAA